MCRLLVTLVAVSALSLVPAPEACADDTLPLRALLSSGQAQLALQRADAALAINPRDASLAFLRGVALMDLARHDDALAQFERLSQEYPDLPDAWNNIATLHARAARLEAARQALDNALRADPTHRAARANLGLVHLMLAAQAWEQLAAAGPLDPALARRLEAVRSLLQSPGR
jgi:tetratricopeptide (TPR) repeat protein